MRQRFCSELISAIFFIPSNPVYSSRKIKKRIFSDERIWDSHASLWVSGQYHRTGTSLAWASVPQNRAVDPEQSHSNPWDLDLAWRIRETISQSRVQWLWTTARSVTWERRKGGDCQDHHNSMHLHVCTHMYTLNARKEMLSNTVSGLDFKETSHSP